ncbi:Aste57867_10849 [Aphanomyces stellatus]|uniref:Aste57867_10849 protein n=1 Tax=Aphanomyces stellatus TaxID=120398 RepID=A0A485KRE4_9STRA|nr:hypothetical protein As57867_010809 [Aphanomyces stellatus]VFT87717.1 Aste57867_10849 [Aphanomyces stellatus]
MVATFPIPTLDTNELHKSNEERQVTLATSAPAFADDIIAFDLGPPPALGPLLFRQVAMDSKLATSIPLSPSERQEAMLWCTSMSSLQE